MRFLLFAVVASSLLACHAASSPDRASTTTSTVASSEADASAPSASTLDDLKSELVTFPSGALTLHGYLWKPAGAGPFPAIVYNHGSEESPGAMNGQAKFFVPHGFVLFVPHRRGQGQSKDAGAYIGSNDPSSPAIVDALVAQSDDVVAAINYVDTLPYVATKRVAVVGCSFGGLESVLAAERANGIVASVDFAGGAATWSHNVTLRNRIRQAARQSKVPMFFLQAENDFDTTPSRELAAEMKSVGKKAQIHIFPPHGTTHEDGHGFCAGGKSPPWGDEVLKFLGDAMQD